MSGTRDFWSRRKAAVAAEVEAEAAARRSADAAEAHARLDSLSDSELLEELNLPEPESLQAGDDFSAFMSHAVPDRLKRRALRALWRTNPVLANVDGLVDYGADFTDAATVVENLQTAYTVGRGMLAHVERLAQADAAPSLPPETAPEPESEPATTTRAPDPAGPQQPAVAVAEADTDDAEPVAPAPRRMIFTYKSETA